ncbi:hypothetical protein [Ornithinimicrobium sp. INDO-MA30-4]|uniref:hypothetical protein n=1 Tax=Ornithinimicrobium sp. INDO-MA30-4 TaxID=2908651 RepID=UPI001F161574|nr:hypothetical protein [Ornithinimicrobium sp. INDO-MA30-4]UJH71046.1 hypothetical protein L0A91_03845 [Ornithinimicrobium sp. INDO-MA30-4]
MIFGLAMAGATSCVGSDSEGSVEPPEAVETDSSQVEEDVAEPDEADETEVEETEAESEAARGSGSGTVTMGDGTVYEIVNLTQCDTSATDPSGFPLETGYGIYGSTADGTVEIFFSRAGLDDDDAFFGGGIEEISMATARLTNCCIQHNQGPKTSASTDPAPSAPLR